MLDFSQYKYNCTGCGACFSICPTNCITMKYDEEGFLYPNASTQCINCGLCKKVCPIESRDKNDEKVIKKNAFAACSKSQDIWQRSASGGAFSEICYSWNNDNCIFVGAAWDGLKVKHIVINDVNKIKPLCKSKYISSYTNDVFKIIKESLAEKKRVVFCGTPCQVAGLKKYLNKDYDDLLLVDFICHGVGSPLVFEECVKLISKQFNMEIKEYEFRYKRKGPFERRHYCRITDGRKYKILEEDQYMQLFLNQLCLRPSCGEHCQFRSANRQSDITIADFNNLGKVFPNLRGSKKNYSTIIFNSKRGNDILTNLKKRMILLECDIESIRKYNPLFFGHTWFSTERDHFFDEFVSSNGESIVKYTKDAKDSTRIPLKRKVYNMLPTRMRSFLLKKRGKYE